MRVNFSGHAQVEDEGEFVPGTILDITVRVIVQGVSTDIVDASSWYGKTFLPGEIQADVVVVGEA